MTTSERREEIARTLFLSDYDEFTPDKIDASSTWLTLRESYLTNADDLLAAFPVLAGVTDEMVDAGARALFEDLVNGIAGHVEYSWAEMVADDPSRADIWRDEVRTVLTAVLGPRPGDGSAS